MIVQKIKHVNRKLVFTNHAPINVLSVSRWKYNAFVNTRVQNKTPRMTTFVTRKVFLLPGWSTMTQLWVVARHKVEENCRTLTTESSVIIYWRHVKCPLLQDRLTPLLGLSLPAYCSKADALSTPQSTPVRRSISITFLSSKKWIAKKFKSLHPRTYSSFKNENTYQSLYDIQMHIRINLDQLLGLGSVPALSIYGALRLRRQ